MLDYLCLRRSSLTHGIPAAAYHEGWAKNGAISGGPTKYGKTLTLKHNGSPAYGGPLFWSHYSFLGLDPRKLKDRYADYWEHNRNHVRINYDYCVENPKHFPGYSKQCWGLTASYSVRFYAGIGPRRIWVSFRLRRHYLHFPYTPTESMAAMRHFYDDLGESLFGKYGFYDAFNQQVDWFPLGATSPSTKARLW